MDILFLILVVVFGTVCFFAGLFLAAGQLIWGIIDVAASPRHSGGTKAAIILLTMLLLGPIMTFFYACFGTHARALRRTTIAALIALVISGGVVLAMASIHGATQQRLAEMVDHHTGFGSAAVDTVHTDALNMNDFKAVHYVPLSARKWSVSVSDFNGSGIIRDTAVAITVPSIYPLNQIAVDPQTGRTYGITTHKFGYIVPATGHFVEIDTDPSLAPLSWPAAIAFDEAHNRVLVVGRGVAFSYDPVTGAWEDRPGFANLGLISLAYDAEEHVYFGLVSEFGVDSVNSIVRLDERGSVLSVIRLTESIAADDLPSGRVQLRKPGRFLVILVSSHYRGSGADEKLVEQRMYAVDPASGDVAVVGS